MLSEYYDTSSLDVYCPSEGSVSIYTDGSLMLRPAEAG